MKRLVSFLKSIYGFSAALGTIIPGLSFFIKKSPPLFPGVAIIVTALSVGLLIHLVLSHPRESSKKGLWLMSLAVCSVLAYFLLFDFTTISPGNGADNMQVGFGLADWSITPDAQSLIRNNICRGSSKYDLIFCVGLTPENIFLIWHRWSVYTAGLSLMLLFTGAALSWVAGWGFLGLAYLAKKSINSNE